MIDLDEIRSYLWSTAQQLWDTINDENTAAADLPKLRLEFFEVNHRLQIVMGRTLTSQTAALQAKADKIKPARDDVRAALETIQSAVDTVNAVTKFLTVVDSFLDAAKKFFV